MSKNRSIIKIEGKKRISFIKILLVPLLILAIVFAGLAVYGFFGANRLMRMPGKSHENFPANILPPFQNTSFPSLDNNTILDGWYFESKKTPVSTVVMVHGFNNDRLQFGFDTAKIYDFFLDKGFNVLSFDLRHSGKSGGRVSTYGYSEWMDVIAAISYVKKISVTTDVLLYGFGSGAAACLLAYEHLPESKEELADFPDNIKAAGISRDYIRAFIMDTAAVSINDYIGYVAEKELPMGENLGRLAVPYAIRMSSGLEKNHNLAAILARVNLPVHLIYGDYTDQNLTEKTAITLEERLRIFPKNTRTYELETEAGQKADSEGKIFYSPDNYLEAISLFVDEFIVP